MYLEELPSIVKRNEIAEDNDYEQHSATTETATIRTNLGGNQGLASRQTQENPQGGTRNSANDEPRSATASAGTGQDSDQALKFNRLQAIRDLDETEKSSLADV